MEHNVAITHFTRIGDMLKKVYQQAVTSNNEMGKYLGNHNYTQQYAEEQRTKIKSDFKAWTLQEVEKMLEAYDLAYNAEMENVKTFEFDSNELRAAVDVISSMGAAMPAECRDYLLKRFRGNYLALCCIVELFRKYELLDNGYQVFSPTVEFTTLRECMKSIVNDPQKSCNGIVATERQINKILRGLGSEIVISTGADNDEYLTYIARSVMGLNA